MKPRGSWEFIGNSLVEANYVDYARRPTVLSTMIPDAGAR